MDGEMDWTRENAPQNVLNELDRGRARARLRERMLRGAGKVGASLFILFILPILVPNSPLSFFAFIPVQLHVDPPEWQARITSGVLQNGEIPVRRRGGIHRSGRALRPLDLDRQ